MGLSDRKWYVILDFRGTVKFLCPKLLLQRGICLLCADGIPVGPDGGTVFCADRSNGSCVYKNRDLPLELPYSVGTAFLTWYSAR